MADKSTIKIKRSSTTNAPSTLNTGELAYSFGAAGQADNGGRLFVGGMGAGSDLNSAIGAPIVIGGKYFTDMLDHVTGTLTASSAVLVDSSKKIDEWLVDNLSLNGNTVSTTDTDGHLVLNPNGSGKVKIANTWYLPRSGGTDTYILTTNGTDATWQQPASSSISLAAGSGSGTVSTGGTLTFTGGVGITTSVTSATVTINSTSPSGYTSTATGGTTTTLTASSNGNQFFTGSTTQTVKLPATSTLVVGRQFIIVNNSSGDLAIQDTGAGGIVTQKAGTQITYTVASILAETWVYEYSGAQAITGSGSLVFSNSPSLVTPSLGVASATSINGLTVTSSTGTLTLANAKTLTVNNTITLAGTDATTITLPSTTGTVALNNQTFYIGTTSVAINRASSNLALTGITSIDGSAASVAHVLTIGTGLSGTSFDGSSAVTVALADGYGDTKNPYAVKTTKYFLAGPVTGSDAAPAFRAIEATDIPTLNQNTSGSAASLSATLVVGSGGTGTTTGSITGTGALSFTAGGSGDQNVNLVPLGSGTVDVSSKRITSVATPTQSSDAATKGYVDATKSGLDVKDSVRVATTANLSATASGTGAGKTLTNSGSQSAITIDSIVLSSGDRVLVKDQTTGANNGIYTVTTVGTASINWVLTRATDADNSPTGEVTAGMFTFVEEGTTNADSGWVMTTNDAITLDTTALAFVQFSGAGQITAGDGLTKTGNTINAVGTTSRITANADSIDIASDYVGQSTITTLGTVGTGTWQGTAVAGQYGGTGVNNSGKTITLGGNLTTSGAYATTLTATANTSITLPTTGTLATLDGSETLTNKTIGSSSSWNGNAIAYNYGGTGFTTYASGDLIYASATNTLSKLTAGDAYTFLQMNASGVPVWGAIDGGTY